MPVKLRVEEMLEATEGCTFSFRVFCVTKEGHVAGGGKLCAKSVHFDVYCTISQVTFKKGKSHVARDTVLRQDPLDLSFWSFLTFLHHSIEEVERHLL